MSNLSQSNNYTSVNNEPRIGDMELRDQIIELEKSQVQLKKSIIETDVALKSPQMKHRSRIIESTYAKEKDHFQEFLVLYKSMSPKERKPYEAMMRKFKEKVNEHKEEINLALNEPKEHKKKLESLHQVWFQNEEQEEEHWKFLLRGFIGIFGAFLFHLMIGAIGRWAIINPYLSSFYKITSDPHIETRRNAIGSPLMMLCTGITMKWGFRRCNQFGQIKVLLIASLGLAVMIFGASMMTELIGFFIFHNVLYGLFAGCLFICPMKECHKYFPKYRLICNSIILAGTGLGAVFWGLINTRCMNPYQEKPHVSGYFTGNTDYVARALPFCMIEMSIILVVISIIAVLCIYPMVKYNNREEEIKLQKGEVPDFENSCYTDEEALKSWVFWMMFFLIIGASLGNFYMVMNYKNLVKKQSDPKFRDENLLLVIVFSGALCNGLFRIVWGLIFRNIGFKYTYLLAVGINILIYALFITIEITYGAYFVLYTLAGFVLGGFMVIFPNACLLVFGDIIGESIYGFYWATFSFSNFLQYLVGSNIKEISSFVKEDITSGWAPFNIHKLVFYPFLLFCILSVALITFGKFQGRWENSLRLLTLKCE